MALPKAVDRKSQAPAISRLFGGRSLTMLVAAGVIFYIAWLLAESAQQVLQFTFNGVVIGAIYSMVALGFTMVYGTVWFFDLSYGAMATLGPYIVFYLNAKAVQTVGRGEVNDPYVNIVMGVLMAGVVAWLLHIWLYHRLRRRFSNGVLLILGGALALGAGAYTGSLLAEPEDLHLFLAPIIGVSVAGTTLWVLYRKLSPALAKQKSFRLLLALGVVGAMVLGTYCGLLVAKTPGARLYLSWVVAAALAGAMAFLLYRGLYFFMRRRARSPLIMLVGSLGVLLAITAFISIIFTPNGRNLPFTFGNDPWTVGGALIKPFQVFYIGVLLALFLGLIYLLKKTSFGKAVRAISDDEEVAKIVGINTTVVISVIFIVGAAIAALGGIFLGQDTAIRPEMGLNLLLKGWIASVVGGIGNIYGAMLGGFVLGLIENYGIWYLASEWKDAFAFILLIFFLIFWPKGLLPRR